MLRQAGLISDSDVRQQMASSLLSKGTPQDRDLQVGGGGDLLQTMMLLNALSPAGGQQQQRDRGQGGVTSAILGGGDPLKSMLISTALSSNQGQGANNNLLPILLMSSMGGKDNQQQQQRGSGSCVGKCGSAMPRQDCGCDIACRQNGDCCQDFDFSCFVQDVQPPQQQFQMMPPQQQFPIQAASFPQFQQQGVPQQVNQVQQPQPKLGKVREALKERNETKMP